jgi:hypothetical protein
MVETTTKAMVKSIGVSIQTLPEDSAQLSI